MKDEISSGHMFARKLILDNDSYIIQLCFSVLNLADGSNKRVDAIKVGDKIALLVNMVSATVTVTVTATVTAIEEVPVSIFNESIRFLHVDTPSKPTKKMWGDCAIIYTKQGGMMILDINTTIDVFEDDGVTIETVKVKRLKQDDVLLNGQVISNIIIEDGPAGMLGTQWDVEQCLLGHVNDRKIIVQLKIDTTYTLEMYQHSDKQSIAWSLVSSDYGNSWSGIAVSFREVTTKVWNIIVQRRKNDGSEGAKQISILGGGERQPPKPNKKK